jgi:hypothetical protein
LRPLERSRADLGGVWKSPWLGRWIPARAPIHCALVFPGRTERDATSWSKGKLRELLLGIVVENEAGHCEISELKQVEGEASCSSRKGKLIFFYEWNIKLAWKGNGSQGLSRAGAVFGQSVHSVPDTQTHLRLRGPRNLSCFLPAQRLLGAQCFQLDPFSSSI